MSRNFEREVEDILAEEPVVIQSFSISEHGIQLDFMDEDEQSGEVLRQQSWLISITSEEVLEAFSMMQHLGRSLIQSIRVAEHGSYFSEDDGE